MKLGKIMKQAAALMLTGICGAAVGYAEEPEAPRMSAAAATVIGHVARDFYKTLEESGVRLDREEFIAGVVAVFFGDTIGGYDDAAAADAALRRVTTPQRGPAVAEADEAAENAWVAEKRELPRAEVLEGGVVLQRLTEGSGEHPAAGSTVKVMYTGRLSNGTIFDQTEEPFDLPTDRIIPGLARAITQMRFGGTYRVFIPPSEGYGKESVMDLIPGNSALDFTIVIVEK